MFPTCFFQDSEGKRLNNGLYKVSGFVFAKSTLQDYALKHMFLSICCSLRVCFGFFAMFCFVQERFLLCSLGCPDTCYTPGRLWTHRDSSPLPQQCWLQLKHALAHPVFSSIIKNFYINYKDFSEKHDYEIKVMESLWSCFSFLWWWGRTWRDFGQPQWSERVTEPVRSDRPCLPHPPISLCLAENC